MWSRPLDLLWLVALVGAAGLMLLQLALEAIRAAQRRRQPGGGGQDEDPDDFERTSTAYAMGDCSPDREILASVEGDIVLRCCICSAPAVVITIGDPHVWVNSAIRRFALVPRSPDRLASLVENLKAGRYQDVHRAMRRAYEGLDYYCPECDCFYCAEHYRAWPDFDEGFYDCSHATCPKGHSRIMDD